MINELQARYNNTHRALLRTEKGLHWKDQNTKTQRLWIYHNLLSSIGPGKHIHHAIFIEKGATGICRR